MELIGSSFVSNSPDSSFYHALDITPHGTPQKSSSALAITDINGYLITDREGIVREIDQVAASLLGGRALFIPGKPLLMFIASADRAAFSLHFSQLHRVNQARKRDFHMHTRAAVPVTLSLYTELYTELMSEHGEIINELHWRVRADDREDQPPQIDVSHDVLEQAKAEVRVLSSRLIAIQETERRSLALDLHDELGQSLTGLKLTLERLAKQAAHADIAEVNDAIQVVSGLIVQVRDLSMDLHPAMLDDLGLLPTLHWHFKRFYAQTRISVSFLQHHLDQRCAPEVETAAYRIVQEALTNAARYAKVNQVQVSAAVSAGKLHLTISDQGVGFDPQLARASMQSNGLTNMLSRADGVGGTLTISAACGGGTRIIVKLPCVPKLQSGLL